MPKTQFLSWNSKYSFELIFSLCKKYSAVTERNKNNLFYPEPISNVVVGGIKVLHAVQFVICLQLFRFGSFFADIFFQGQDFAQCKKKRKKIRIILFKRFVLLTLRKCLP